jgi:hypothetical protein
MLPVVLPKLVPADDPYWSDQPLISTALLEELNNST